MYGNYLAFLAVDMDAAEFLPLGLLNTDLDLRHSGASDKAEGGSYHSDDKNTLDISACTRVGLLPLGGKMAGQALQFYFRLCYHQAAN